jgi:hypothetical protein
LCDSPWCWCCTSPPSRERSTLGERRSCIVVLGIVSCGIACKSAIGGGCSPHPGRNNFAIASGSDSKPLHCSSPLVARQTPKCPKSGGQRVLKPLFCGGYPDSRLQDSDSSNKLHRIVNLRRINSGFIELLFTAASGHYTQCVCNKFAVQWSLRHSCVGLFILIIDDNIYSFSSVDVGICTNIPFFKPHLHTFHSHSKDGGCRWQQRRKSGSDGIRC